MNRPRPEDLFPAAGSWPTAAAKDVGMNEAALKAATDFAISHETDWPRSMYMPNGHYIGTAYVQESGPNSDVVGPVKERGPANGMIIRYGKLAADLGRCLARRHDLFDRQELSRRSRRPRGGRRLDQGYRPAGRARRARPVV